VRIAEASGGEVNSVSLSSVLVGAAHSEASKPLAIYRSEFERYLVDPASSHMLVSKIKPCMSKHVPRYGEAANSSLQQPSFIRISLSYLDNCGNSRANTCEKARTARNERIY
jgi:hypothetical protein